jgi:glutathione synthase/RimK-type ligase-like ATP-grasp enzyme
MSIAILYERSETDEMGIKLTAEKLGINLIYIPFRKVSVKLNENGYSVRSIGKNYSQIIKNVSVILNRTQSKNRRLFAANIFEAFGKHVINTSLIEFLCYSKLRTLLRFWKTGIKTPMTVYVPCDPHEHTKTGTEIHNEKEIADLIQQELGNGDIVVKPDAGTHGTGVKLAKGRDDLITILDEVKPSIINPIGVLSQEMVQKWFYDLRIIVTKEYGKSPYCHPKAMARTGFKEFRTNAALGNMVFDVDLPSCIMKTATKCGETIGANGKAWVIALDAMINVGEDKIVGDEYLKAELEKIEPFFNAIKKVKSDETKKTNFKDWNNRVEEAFQNYKDSKAYENICDVIQKSIERNKRKVLFHEANSCPEFWEQTRLITGINLAESLLCCAQSIMESEN